MLTAPELKVASTASTATTGNLAASTAALREEDDDIDVDCAQIDGGIDSNSTNGDNGGSRGINCRVGRQGGRAVRRSRRPYRRQVPVATLNASQVPTALAGGNLLGGVLPAW